MSWQIQLKDALTTVDTPGQIDTLDTYIWIVKLISIGVCIALFLVSSSYLSKEDHFKGFTTLAGAVIAGISPYLAVIFI